MKTFKISVSRKGKELAAHKVETTTKRLAAETVADWNDHHGLVTSTPSVFVHDDGRERTVYTVEAVDRRKVHGALEL